MQLLDHLQKREADGKPIRVGLVGCGQEGSGMVHVTHNMAGMETYAIADLDVKRPLKTLADLGVPESTICVTNHAGQGEDALRAGKYVVTENALLLAQLPSLDALVEATGVTEVGAQVAWHSIMHKKHVVMLNVETDVTVGLMLSRMAEQAGCVYTASTGDEPGVCKQLYDFSRTLGFEVVCLGKGKNNPINYYANPDTARAEALSKNMNPKMLAAFQDGTKTMVEMAAMANATGLVPDVPGAHGAKVDVPDLNKVFVPQEDGGILSRRGCVDYSVGKVAPGVFIIVTSDDPHTRADMKFYSMGDGPYYTLYRPFHLCSIETPQAVAEAVVYGEAVLKPQALVAELVSVAKRDLKAGQQVDGIGGFDFFSRIYTAQEAKTLHGIPMGLTPGGRVHKDVGRGELLTYDNFAPDTTQLVYKLRQLQDSIVGYKYMAGLLQNGKMQAVVVRAPMDFGVESVPVPVAPPGGLLLRVKACGLCGSDLRTLRYGHRKVQLPYVIGHEICGVVAETGPGYSGRWTTGDLLSMGPVVYCGHCDFCLEGRYELCENYREIAQAWPGGLAEYMAVPPEAIHLGVIERVPAGVDPGNAAIAEPISSCLNAQERGQVGLGDTVVIIGAGPIGCIHIALARLHGADRVIIADINAERLKLAEPFAPDAIIDVAKLDLVSEVRRLTNGRGSDVTITATPAPGAVVQAVEMARKGGRILLFGGLPKDDSKPPVDMNLVHYNALALIGTTTFAPRHYRLAMQLAAANRIPVDKLITHRLPLAQFKEGATLALEGKVLKAVFIP